MDIDLAASDEPDNVIDFSTAAAHASESNSAWFDLPPRLIAPEDWKRFRASIAEIFSAFGMDIEHTGHARDARAVPARALRRDRRLRR